MARRRREEGEDNQATPSDVRPAISQKKLRELLNLSRKAQADVDEINGGVGAAIKAAQEKHHLHRKAFNVCKSADHMEPEKLADFLDCLDHYLDISGLRERAASAPRMQLGDGETEEEETETEETTGRRGRGNGNVRPFPAPTSQAAE